VIANGGILTHPDRKREELNLADVQPSLVYVDIELGDLVEERRLAPELHQLSIRHLTVAQKDMVVFGCQYRGPERDLPPLIGFHRRARSPSYCRPRIRPKRRSTITSGRSRPTPAAPSLPPRPRRAASSPIGTHAPGASWAYLR